MNNNNEDEDMIKRIGYDGPVPSKAWVQVEPSQSVPGTEDDETFFLGLEEKKERAREYRAANHDRIRATARRWYEKNRAYHRAQCNEWSKRHPQRTYELKRRYEAKRAMNQNEAI